MEYSNDTPICRRNKHLNQFERSKIEVLISLGYSPYAIAKIIKRAPNTVRNELKREAVSQIKAAQLYHNFFPNKTEHLYKEQEKLRQQIQAIQMRKIH